MNDFITSKMFQGKYGSANNNTNVSIVNLKC